MAADQLNKRSKVTNIIRHTSWELQKAKKKKTSHYDFNTRSIISLEWDKKKEHVVPKKEQISIARRELTQFLPCDPNYQNVLGDVFAAPPELFELDNLTGLLSYEVWQTHLSVEEREFLTQLLPEGAEPHKMVHDLLAGNNLFFGNPFPKWGASICSGNCHPDAILRQEQCNKANKIAYYSELQKYHTKMIGSLQSWKERWASCVNPEKDFIQEIRRSRKDFNKSGSSQENDNLGATSDSCSWDADAKSYSSDCPGEAIMRASNTDSGNKYYNSSGGWRSVARPKKGDNLHRLNIECGDGAKYMSYIKVSKEQHERVKSSMKHSNTSIQPRSLNHVLGNLDSFCVQPYEVFEEEERQKLHNHWLSLAKKDLPAGFENWKILQSAKQQMTKSLRKEMEDEWKSNVQSISNLYGQNEENEENHTLLLHGTYNATLDNENMNATKDEEKEQSLGNLCHEQHIDGETHDELSLAQEDHEEQNADAIFQSEANLSTEIHERSMQMEQPTEESSQDSAQNHHLPSIVAIHNASHNFLPITMAASVLTESDAFPSSLGEFTENINHTNTPVGEQYPLPPTATEIWPPSSYYHQPASVSHGYPSINENPLRSFHQRRSDGGDSFFYPYTNQDRNELLLHSLFKDPATSPYLQEHKLSRLGFHPTVSDPMMATGQFPRNLCSSLPLDPRQKRVNDVFLHQNIQENIFPDEGVHRFSIPINHAHDWTGNSVVNIRPPSSSHHRSPTTTGDLSSQNWFSGDAVVRGGWSDGVVPNQVADESLFSVLQCNELRSGVHFGSTEQSGSYVGVGRGVVPATTTTAVPPRAARGAGLVYASGNEGQFVVRNNGLGWINSGGRSLWNDNELG